MIQLIILGYDYHGNIRITFNYNSSSNYNPDKTRGKIIQFVGIAINLYLRL